MFARVIMNILLKSVEISASFHFPAVIKPDNILRMTLSGIVTSNVLILVDFNKNYKPFVSLSVQSFSNCILMNASVFLFYCPKQYRIFLTEFICFKKFCFHRISPTNQDSFVQVPCVRMLFQGTGLPQCIILFMKKNLSKLWRKLYSLV